MLRPVLVVSLTLGAGIPLAYAQTPDDQQPLPALGSTPVAPVAQPLTPRTVEAFSPTPPTTRATKKGLRPMPQLKPAPPSERDGRPVMPPPAFPGAVPDLPSSRPCAKKDMEGLWKLLQVYEEPTGEETAAFYNAPSQYMRYNANGTYDQYFASEDVEMSDGMFDRAMKQMSTGLQQYVLQNNGMMYFYQNSIAAKSQACFIVESQSEYFPVGQMLLMPPTVQAQTRWVKVYSKVYRPNK